MKEEALDRTMWRNRFGRGFGPVVRQITDDDDRWDDTDKGYTQTLDGEPRPDTLFPQQILSELLWN